MTPEQYANLYFDHQQPEKQPLYAGRNGRPGPTLSTAGLTALCMKLLGTTSIDGTPIILDDQIDANGEHPFYRVQERLRYGQTFWPDLRMILAMGGTFPTDFNYKDSSLPIKNTLNPADLPRYSGPVLPTMKLVGEYAGEGRYNLAPGVNPADHKNGEVIFEERFYYRFLGPTPIGEFFWVMIGLNPPPDSE